MGKIKRDRVQPSTNNKQTTCTADNMGVHQPRGRGLNELLEECYARIDARVYDNVEPVVRVRANNERDRGQAENLEQYVNYRIGEDLLSQQYSY